MPTEEELDAQRSIRTFYTYILSWRLCCSDRDNLLAQQSQLDNFQQLETNASTEPVKGHFLRGFLTLKAMQQLPLDSHPELAMSANFWAPVQAYYAVHGFGLSCLASLGLIVPTDHRRFRSTFSSRILSRLMPYPFNVLCSGNPFGSNNRVSFSNLPTSVTDIIAVSNLSNPNKTNAPLFVGKSVFTTRKWMLGELFEKRRTQERQKNHSRHNLSRIEKEKTAENLHDTSLIDLLYRMRVRSNYDDPEMFIYGQTDTSTAQTHYENLLTLVEMFAALCGNIIAKKIGHSSYQQMTGIVSRAGLS